MHTNSLYPSEAGLLFDIIYTNEFSIPRNALRSYVLFTGFVTEPEPRRPQCDSQSSTTTCHASAQEETQISAEEVLQMLL